ncbi:MAG: His/Gly/Thr/Pro-type tRNA ligase C-terminal domain-containing protein, partial [Holosporaceae bacterium]
GGDLSHEFIVLAPSGESTLLYDATFKPGTPLTLDDIHNVYAVTDDQHNPETCPLKADQLKTSKGIEVGHVFYFGTKYSAPLGGNVMDDKGELTPVHMGSYGIGVSRVLAALIEIFSDEKGMVWPQSVAPFDFGLLNLKIGDDTCTAMADALYTKLKAAGIDVLYDDRDRPAGFKLNDMDLVGLPYQIILGPQNAAKGQVELKARATGKTICLSAEALMAKISAADGVAKLSSLFGAAQCA